MIPKPNCGVIRVAVRCVIRELPSPDAGYGLGGVQAVSAMSPTANPK